MKIFLDTTELKAEPCRLSKSFAQLTQLAISGFVEIHFSRINISEIESWIAESIKKQEAMMLEAISKATNFGLSDQHFSTAQPLTIRSSDWFKKTAYDATDAFHKWLKEIKAIVHEIDPSDGTNVMNAYFSGEPPFRQVKERDDIPDAFIWQSLNRLNGESEEIFFVSGDKVFRNRVNEHLKNLKVFNSLRDLFEQPQLIMLVDHWDAASKQAYTEALIEMIEAELDVQRTDIQTEVGHQIENYLTGMFLKDYAYGQQGRIIDVRMPDPPDVVLDYIQMTTSPNLYMNFDIDLEVTVALSLLLLEARRAEHNYKMDRIYENGENSTDTHIMVENYHFLRVHGELVIELPTLSEKSGKVDVIDAVEECDIKISKVKIEFLS